MISVHIEYTDQEIVVSQLDSVVARFPAEQSADEFMYTLGEMLRWLGLIVEEG